MITFLIDEDIDSFAVYEYQDMVKAFPLSKLTKTLLRYVKEGHRVAVCRRPDIPSTTSTKGDVCKRKDIHICDKPGQI